MTYQDNALTKEAVFAAANTHRKHAVIAAIVFLCIMLCNTLIFALIAAYNLPIMLGLIAVPSLYMFAKASAGLKFQPRTKSAYPAQMPRPVYLLHP